MVFKPYHSVRDWSAETGTVDLEFRRKVPPWRGAVGRAWLTIDSEFGNWTGETLFPLSVVDSSPASPPGPPADSPPPPPASPPPPPSSPPPVPPDSPPAPPSLYVSPEEYAEAERHATIYLEIIQETFANFSDEPVGRLGYERGPDWDTRPIDQRPVRWAWDDATGMDSYGLLPDETTIAFEERESKGGRPCWNCGQVGHAYGQCKQPLNRARIAAARGQLQRDTARSLELLDLFKPGQVSDELRQALFADEDDDEFAATRTDYPWFQGMLMWGYPSGWITSRGELTSIELIRSSSRPA